MNTNWVEIRQRKSIKLYAGSFNPRRHDYPGFVGLALANPGLDEIVHNVLDPIPLEENSVDIYVSEDVFEYIPYSSLVSVFNEIHRVLKPGGLFRLALPDYNCKFLQNRVVKDENGDMLYDPGAGGSRENPLPLWFPTADIISIVARESKFSVKIPGIIKFLHYMDHDSHNILFSIDHSVAPIFRTPDFDPRVQNPRRVMSLVVDMKKMV